MIASDHDSIVEFLPTTGWLGLYMKFTDGMEICPRFRFFSACAVLGAAVNNRVWIQRGDEGLLPRLMPNPWVILLAPPGRGHKTTAINMACNCLQQACPEARVLADKLTPEYLIKGLASPLTKKEMIRIGPRDATGVVKASELSVFFGKQQYNVGLISLVTDLYDYREEWKGGTIARGGEILRNNCITVFGGSTPTWLQHMLPEDAFTGGFMSRFILVEMPPTYFKKITQPRKPKGLEWKDMVSSLRSLSDKCTGQMRWGKGAEEAYDAVYEDCKPTGDPQRDAYREREPEQILKVAMLLALDHNRLDLVEKDITRSYKMMQSLRVEINPRIDRLTTHPRMQLTQEIVDLLKLHGLRTEGELLNDVYRSLIQGEHQFYEALSILKKTGKIEPVGKPGQYSYQLRKVGK